MNHTALLVLFFHMELKIEFVCVILMFDSLLLYEMKKGHQAFFISWWRWRELRGYAVSAVLRLPLRSARTRRYPRVHWTLALHAAALSGSIPLHHQTTKEDPIGSSLLSGGDGESRTSVQILQLLTSFRSVPSHLAISLRGGWLPYDCHVLLNGAAGYLSE